MNVDPVVPVVSVASGKVLLDGRPLDDVTDEFRARPRRFDGLFGELRSARDAWLGAHPGAAFPGAAALRLDPSLPSVLVKNVFQTAAFAGYPNEGFVVHRADVPAALGVVPFSAIVPIPGDAPPVHGPLLLVDVRRAEPVALSWISDKEETKSLGRQLAAPGDPNFGTVLAGAVVAEWQSNGRHRDAADTELDHALVRVDHDVPYGTLVQVLDALYEPKREFSAQGRSGNIPVFDARISIAIPDAHTESPLGAPLAGRLAPEAIQSTIRGRYDDLRKCYEGGLARNADLKGRVQVRFRIERDGKVSSLEATKETTLSDPAAVTCMLGVFRSFVFPKPEGGIVTVVYPIVFEPG